MFRMKLILVLTVFMGLALAVFSSAAPGQQAQAQASADCALLDDPAARGIMSAMFERMLLETCGRLDELPAGVPAAPVAPLFPTLTDVIVNNPAGDTGTTHTQSETSITVNEDTGTICSGYNDSFHGVTQGLGYSGFSRSIDGGASFVDGGPMDASSYGDPSMVWRRLDGYFYYASIHATYGIGLYRSTNDCQSFLFLSGVAVGDDKELMAIDNNPASSYYGRIYIVSTNFGAGGQIYSTYSDNGTTWSTAVSLSGGSVQGAWPVVAPNGDVYVSWVHWGGGDTIDIEVTRSTNGGVSYTRVTNPISGATNPHDQGATNNCGRDALNGNIRYLPSPQIAVDPDGVVHVVYSYDPDGYNLGDVVNVYYRRSLDHGLTWQAEIRLNDDATLTDQWFPSLSVSDSAISAAWYDRRLDTAGNYLFTYFARLSLDGGVTWEPSEQISDVPSPVYIDPQLNTCYHGDYDQQIQFDGAIYIQWSDDRNVQSSHNDPDVWFDKKFVMADFKLEASPAALSICVPDEAVYNLDLSPIWIFSQPVSLTVESLPAGLVPSFSVNPVTPPGTSVLTLDTTAGAAGSYNLAVVGEAVTLTHAVSVGLELFTSLSAVPDLLSPASEARNISTRPTFTWQAEQGQLYDIEVASDPAFTQIVASALGLAAASYTPAADLPANTVLYWRVLAHNPCGYSAWSETWRFLTAAVLGQCALGTTPNPLFGEGFEGLILPAGWATGGTGSTWDTSLVRKHSGSRSFLGEDVDTVSDQWLISPALALPTNQSPLLLSFWGYRKFQASGCFDGGLVEITTDGGATWNALDAQLRAGAYDGTIASASNPLNGQRAWCTPQNSWINTMAALDEFAGQTVQFRYRLGTDDAVSHEGWYVDDVSVQSCLPSTALGPDSSLLAMPGETVTHTFVLANQSAAADSFTLAVTGYAWPTTLVDSSPITLTAGETATLSVRVEVPAAFASLSDEFTLSATSLGIPGISLQALGETNLDIHAAGSFSPAQSGSGHAGQIMEYTFTFTNTGNYTDTFTLSVSGLWDTFLPDGTSLGPLGAGESLTVTLLVAIPVDALPGDSDVTVLTAASSLDGSVAVAVNATSSVVVFYPNYLPLVKK
jgi:hypothetical protein